jgi:hypothetical protein
MPLKKSDDPSTAWLSWTTSWMDGTTELISHIVETFHGIWFMMAG